MKMDNENNDFEKEVMDLCCKYSAKSNPENFIESLTVLTQAYMDQCGLSLTYRTLVEGAGMYYWMDLLRNSDHPLAKKARNHSFTGIMPDLSEEFDAQKEHYWNDYDITVLDSETIIAATPGLLDEYAHNEPFKIAYCAGLIPYLQSTRESEEDYRQYLAEMKKNQ